MGGLIFWVGLQLAAPPVGSSCVLKTTLKGYKAPSENAARQRLNSGSELTLLAVEDDWLRWRTSAGELYLTGDLVEKWCSLVEAEVSPGVGSPAPEPQSSEREVRLKIAINGLESGVDDEQRKILFNAMTEALDETGAFAAVSTLDVVSVLEHQANQQSLGCADESCLSEIGEMLGADYLIDVTARETKKGREFQLRLFNANEAAVENRVSGESVDQSDAMQETLISLARNLVSELLRMRSGMLRLWVSEEGATLRLDDRIVGVSPTEALVVAGGFHRLEIEKEGFVVYRRDIQMLQGVEVSHRAELRPSDEYRERFESRARSKRRLGWGLLGGGIGAALTAGALAVTSHNLGTDLNVAIDHFNREPERATSAFESLERKQNLVLGLDIGTLVAAGAAVALGATGGYLLATSDNPRRYHKQLRVAVKAGPGRALVAFSGRF